MKDCSNNVRTAYLNKLNGFISYNGKNVPVYGDDSFKTPPQNYVIIGDIIESAQNTNQSFTSNVDVTIDIFSEQYLKRDNSIVDNIANQILTLLIPTTGIADIGDSDFQIHAMARTSSRYLAIDNGQNYIARKILIINNLVNQK
jgi:uncharacterized protein YoxC